MTRRMLSVLLLVFEVICVKTATGRPQPYNRQTLGFPVPVYFDDAADFPDVTLSQISTSINSSPIAGGDVDLGVGMIAELPSGIGLAAQVGAPLNINGRNLLQLQNDVSANVLDNLFKDINDIDIDIPNLFEEAELANVDGNTGLGLALDAGLGLGVNADNTLNLGAGLGLGVDTRTGIDAQFGTGLDLGTETDVVLDINTGVNAATNLDLGFGVNLDAGLGTDISTDLDMDSAVGIGLNTGVNISLDTAVNSDLIKFFKLSLAEKLLRDKYFRYIFSEYVPIPALNLVTAAIAQYLTKAFVVPRSVFLPFEKNVLILASNKTPTVQAYADTIATTVAAILSGIKIITPTAARLQVAMAARAISSGISNFLGISAIPGLGLSITSNSYNSFYSILNGFEKLPYVGSDALSRKLPPIFKTAKASSFAIQFATKLYNSLVYSNQFFASVSLGVPASAYQIVANSLGKFMAEAFGCRSSSFFAKIYANYLMNTITNLNYRIYAKLLSLATTRALYLLGYFLSGDVNIQAAIATNAILRALNTRFLQNPIIIQAALFPGVYGLPRTTQLAGVAPSNLLLKRKDGVGVGAKIGPGVGLYAGNGVGTMIGLGFDAGAGMDAGIGLGADVGLEAAVGVDTSIGSGLGSNRGKGKRPVIGLATGVGLDEGTELDAGIELDADVGVGAGIGSGSDWKKGRRSDFGLKGTKRTSRRKTDLFSDIDTDADFETLFDDADFETLFDNADLGVGLDAGIGFEVGGRKQGSSGVVIDAGVGLGSDVDVELGADLELGSNTNLEVDFGSDFGVDGEIAFGLGRKKRSSGLGSDAGVGVGAIIGLGSDKRRRSPGLELDTKYLDADTGVNTGLGLGLKADVGLGTDVGLDAGVELGLGLESDGKRNGGSGIVINTNHGIGLEVKRDGNTPGTKLTVLHLLPKILADKFYKSTALYTSFSMVGPRKVVNLIAEGMAVEYGFPIASLFLKSYDKYIIRNSNGKFISSMLALANATCDALAETGILNSTFSVQKVNQLATALTTMYSSLIATSLET